MDNILSNLSYNDYLAMLCFWDSEWSLHRNPFDRKEQTLEKTFIDDHIEFTKLCNKYREDIDDNYIQYSEANGLKFNESEKIVRDSSKGFMKSFLFNPANFLTFGHSDNLSIILLDDFDPVNHITSGITKTIEDVSLGFCPKIESLNLKNIDFNRYQEKINNLNILDTSEILKYSTVFTELHIVFDLKKGLPGEKLPIQQQFQNTYPLLTYSKFKMNRHGLLYQYALYRAMSIKILFVLSQLYQTSTKIKKTAGANIINSCDLEQLKIVFIDLQGNEEIGVLILCNNYSLAISIIASLRSLTIEDLLNADDTDRLKDNFDVDLNSNLNFKIAKESFKNQDDDDKPFINKNHIFLWSNSTLAISPAPFLNPELLQDNGFVEAFTEFQISPGHQNNVEKLVDRYSKNNTKLKSIVLPKSAFRQYHIGVPDLFFKNRYHDESPDYIEIKKQEVGVKKFIPLYAVIEILKTNLELFGTKMEKDHGRDVIDIATRLIIPLPVDPDFINKDEIFPDVDKHHYSLISESLSIIGKELFHTRQGKISLQRLKEALRLYNIPVSLRRNIEFLYQNYASLFVNPYTFDSIIDMYGPFIAFHKLLTDCFSKMKIVKSNKVGPQSQEILLNDSRVEQLAMFLTALHDSLWHRISKSYPETLFRDMAIDFRGGLNQMIYSADAFINCSLDLLRNSMKGVGSTTLPCVGGLIKISYKPGAVCFSYKFGVENELKLASFELDVPHIFHLPSYIENFHEVAHLIFDTLTTPNNTDNLSMNFDSGDEIMKERLSEVFSDLLCHLFIFGPDTTKMIYYKFCNYTKSITSIGKNDYITVTRFTEFLIRLFIVIDVVPDNFDVMVSVDQWRWKKRNTKREALNRFKEMVNKYGMFFSDYERLWKEPKNVNYCYRQFIILYPKINEYMGEIWNLVVTIHNNHLIVLNEVELNSIEKLKSQILIGLEQGRPIVKKLFFSNHRDRVEFADGFVSLLLCCRALDSYIPNINELGLFNKRIHLNRDASKARCIDYSDGNNLDKEWATFQLDRGYASMFSPVPEYRKIRIRKQIMLFKSFWDISASQRERCLNSIIQGHLDNKNKTSN